MKIRGRGQDRLAGRGASNAEGTGIMLDVKGAAPESRPRLLSSAPRAFSNDDPRFSRVTSLQQDNRKRQADRAHLKIIQPDFFADNRGCFRPLDDFN